MSPPKCRVLKFMDGIIGTLVESVTTKGPARRQPSCELSLPSTSYDAMSYQCETRAHRSDNWTRTK